MKKLRNSFGPFEFTTNVLTSLEEVTLWVRAQETKGVALYGLDLETAKHGQYITHPQAGLDPILSQIRLVQLYDGAETFVIDLWHTPGAWETLVPFFNANTFVAHNAKFELKHFTYNNLPSLHVHCSYLLSSLTHKAEHPQFEKAPEIPGDEVFDEEWDGMSHYRFIGHSLDAVVGRLYKIKIPKHLQISNWNARELSTEQLLYAGLDALLTYRVFCDLWPKAEEHGLQNAYELTRKLQYPITMMELEGIPVDWQKHSALVAAWEQDREALLPRIQQWFGTCNLNSSKQKGEWLRWYLTASGQTDLLETWPLTKKAQETKTDTLSFSKGTLVDYNHLEPIKLLLEYSKLEKLLSTYGEALLKHRHPITNCLHTGFKLASTQTGRLSSAQPNLQNMPRDNPKDPEVKQMRRIFSAPEGYQMVFGDLSQIEMRVAAEVSNDNTLKYCFENGVDTHRLVVNSVFGTPIEQVTKQERQFGKAINFGLMFGMGWRKLIKYAKLNYGVELDESLALQGVVAFKNLYCGLVQWADRVRDEAEISGFTTTPLGEKRMLSEDQRYTHPVNTPIQGGAAEVLKVGLYYAWEELQKRGMQSVLITTVHDETGILAPDNEAEEARVLLEQCKTKAMQDLFPNASIRGLIDAGCGDSWATAKK